MKVVLRYARKKARSACKNDLSLWTAVAFALGFAAAAANAAQSVTLAWDPSPDASVVGYYLRYGTTSGVYSEVVDTGSSTTGSAEGLVSGTTYYFTVTAYTAQRIESEGSGEIAYTVPGPPPTPPPGGMRMVGGAESGGPPRLQFLVPPAQVYEVHASEDLRSWKKVHTSVSLTTNWIEFADPQAALLPKRFYRLALPEGPQIPGVISLLRGNAPRGAVCLRPQVAQGQRYQIQASQDLRTWTVLHDATCAAGRPLDFVDAAAGSYSSRYYRLALLDTVLASSALEIRRVDVEDESRLRVSALAGQPYRVEASQDHKTWRTIYQAVSTSAEPVELIDPNAPLFQKRFYRLAFD